jgi:hypothetical protein|tara:strand:- start:1725 stop:1841 length:117 start_codon:yes stop_codon:yes gene_type:complete
MEKVKTIEDIINQSNENLEELNDEEKTIEDIIKKNRGE